MNKAELTESAAEKARSDKNSRQSAAIGSVYRLSNRCSKEGDSVQLVGFGYIQSESPCRAYWS